MPTVPPCSTTRHRVVLATAVLAGILGSFTGASAQRIQDLRTPTVPLVLAAQGSFYVGGERVVQDSTELGSRGPGGHITVNQMYVRYMIPETRQRRVPVVLVHGATLTGKSYETTPDGRMGWDEYFVRQGFPVYVPDQVSRGRSGFNQAIFNNVAAGRTPLDSQPRFFRFSDEAGVWTNFRFGPSFGVPFRNEQFPVEAVDELAKQSVPDVNAGLPSPNPNWRALSDLATELEGAVLLGHSQGGRYPLDAALLNPEATKGLVLVEPGSCGEAVYTDEQIATLATIPILVLFGANLPAPTGFPGPTWQDRFNGCQTFIARVTAAGGNARMVYPPDLGIRGNSHMIMQDRNSLRIADLIVGWLNLNVARPNRPRAAAGVTR